MRALRETFLRELADIYDAEKQILKALPRLAKAADYPELRHGLEEHLEQTEEQVSRLEQVFEVLGENPKPRKCRIIPELVKEAEDLIKEKAGDAALICAAQKIEHYEIAAYGSVHSWARLLGEEDAADLLEETLDEEKAADERLTEIGENSVNVDEAPDEAEVGDDPGDEEEDRKSKGR
jgi:ferritin-like metal-binding protein YciE